MKQENMAHSRVESKVAETIPGETQASIYQIQLLKNCLKCAQTAKGKHKELKKIKKAIYE